MFRHRINGSLQLLLDHEDILLIGLRDEIDRESDLPEAATSADTMQVGGGILGEIEVYDHVDAWYVDASGY